MEYVVPDYYQEFRCIAGECRHSCCIGWEIDIDPATLAYYEALPGELGEKLRANISREGDPHFVLGEEERCPFLNGENLCELILGLGEEHLCGICTDHPRFRNELPGRVETGLGLCCEEAGRLILGRKTPVALVVHGEREEEDAVLTLRDQAISLLQDRSRSVESRVEGMLSLCGGVMPRWDMGQWAGQLLKLERLDEAWTELLTLLRENWKKANLTGFDAHMAGRQTEYEQLLVYLVYRHLANATDLFDMAPRAAFAALGYQVLRHLGALLWTEKGTFSFADQVELARLFSSEIEYSEENLECLLEQLF